MPVTLENSAFGLLRFPLAEELELRLRPGLDITTRAGFEALCEDNPDLRIERWGNNGKLTIDMPTKGFTGIRNSLLDYLIASWALQNGEGFSCDSSTGFTLPDGSILSPGAAWVRKMDIEALTKEEKEDFLPVTPPFVVEIRSKSDRLTGLWEKMALWQANGVLLGLLIDPEAKRVEIYRPNTEAVILEKPISIDCSPELPGFVLDVQKLFELPAV